MDSRASWHITRNQDLLHSIKGKEGTLIFGNLEKNRILTIRQVKVIDSTFISNVLLVENLRFNLLSMNQL
jgi:hypothetical protein